MGAAVTDRFGSFPSCHRCRERALRSPRFRRQFSCAARARVSLVDVQRIFAGIGVHDVPTTGGECDAALRLPEGSTAAALGGA